MPPELPFIAIAEDEVELTVVDLGVARALWEGIPTGRLLARIRLHRDERDLIDLDQRATGVEFADASWDIILARLLAAAPTSLERVKRAIARHAHAAFDLGPLAAGDTAIASLVDVLLSASDADASPSEGAAEALAVEEPVRLACARFDERLGRVAGDRRATSFEACLELAKRGAAPPWPLDAFRSALRAVSVAQGGVTRSQDEGVLEPVTASGAPLYPWSDDGEVPVVDRRVCLLDRPNLERVVLHPERELAAAVTRAAKTNAGLPVAKILADITPSILKHGALLLVATREPRSQREAPRLPPASWAPENLDATETALSLASALERGSVTAPRVRSHLIRGGDLALDALGKEMLNVAAHPFASAVFAELLAPFARERDVVRLVTYFAIAPDPAVAAHALSLCNARELVCSVLKSWLETMLPAEGAHATRGSDPETSTSARVMSYVTALQPYPSLYRAVRPLLGAG